MNKVLIALASATLAACSPSPTNVQTQTPTSSTPSKVNLPSLNNSMVPQLESGTITLTNNSGPGTATFTAAPVFDEDGDPNTPPAFGSGVFSVQISVTTYASSAAQSAFMTATDESSGTSYLLLNLFAQGSGNNGQELTVITPTSSFVAGGTVAFDGQNSYAVFGSGDVTQPEPSFFAVATSGSVTFAATASLTGTIDATLTATFTQAQITPDPTDSPDGGVPTRTPDGGTPPPAPIPSGTYAFVDDGPTQVVCYGSLVGKEGDFSSLAPATWAFSGSSITVSNTNGSPTASAPEFTTLFGQTALTLSAGYPGGPPWYFESAPQAIAGAPDGTTLVDAAFILESDPGNTVDGNFALAFALDSDQSAYCSVTFLYGVASP
jgi:hypothetical protein